MRRVLLAALLSVSAVASAKAHQASQADRASQSDRASAQADLKKAMAEPDLEKRSKLALDNAFTAYQSARDAYAKGDMDRLPSLIDEMQQSVDLAVESLNHTGKNPRRSPKYFKAAELATRDLTRRISSFQDQMSYSERPMLDKLKARVQQVHDELLLGLMEGKK